MAAMPALALETDAPRRASMTAGTPDPVRAAHLANSFLRTALDQTSEGIMIVEPSLAHRLGPRILLHNTRMAAMVGAEPERGLRDRFITQLVASEEEAASLLLALRKTVKQGGAFQWEGGLKTLYGKGMQPCLWRIRAVMDEHARVYNYTLVLAPVSIISSPITPGMGRPTAPVAADEPRRLRNDNIADLTPGILHDIRHALGIIMTNLSEATRVLPAHTEVGQHVDEALAAAQQASEFAMQALRMTKDLPERREPSEMAALIRSTARISQSGSGVNLHMSLPRDLWWAVVDTARISQVLQNLILNGIQAMNNQGHMDVLARNVMVPAGHDALPAGPYVEVLVRDRGCGLDPLDVQRALHESFTNKSNGNGLGLTTCKRIIQDHHGHIALSSMKNVCTEVVFWLPATHPREAMAQRAIAAPKPNRAGLGNILVVDDEEKLRKIVHVVLKRCGYRVFEAASGEEAVTAYRHLMRHDEEVDMVIMDLTLKGGLDGEEAARGILGINPQAKIVASSGGMLAEARASYLARGFCEILPKPYLTDQISDVVHRVLNQHAAPEMVPSAA
jgi:signal transduction histidine kinase/ActR/RegA family two-component response regulator